ncbi:MAG: hypothetical protein HY721_13315 [Planctomycetes bacterium]|nr:hypothetical protein [Planctomycetota bacterium]
MILERDSPKPDAEIGRLLAYHLALHPTDAILRVRYGGGLVADGVPEDVADDLARRLREIGVRARKIDAALWAVVPRGCRAFGLAFGEEALEVRLVTGRRLLVPRRDIFALHLHAMAGPSGAKGGDKAARPSIADAEVLSARGRKLLENLVEAGLEQVELHLSLLCAEPFGAVRVRRSDFDFSCLGVNVLEHSLDNFLILLDEVLLYLPEAWNRRAAEAFLETLDPKRILHFKEEEATNLERWLFQWIRIETEERSGKEGP